jgi:hypothetical protein
VYWVSADAEEIADLDETIRQDRRGRRLYHDAQRHRLGGGHTRLLQAGGFLVHHLARALDLVEPCDERNHQMKIRGDRPA